MRNLLLIGYLYKSIELKPNNSITAQVLITVMESKYTELGIQKEYTSHEEPHYKCDSMQEFFLE